MSNLMTPGRNDNNSILKVYSNDEIDENEQARQDESKEKPLLQFVTSLGSHIRNEFSLSKTTKEPHTEKMIRSLKQRKGIYSAEMLASLKDNGQTEIFMRLTDVKCRAAQAWIKDILSGTDKPWIVESTPVPELSPEQEQAMMQQAQMLIMQQGYPQDAIQEMLEKARGDIKKQLETMAKDAADKMAVKIEDQLAEGGFDRAFEDFIYDVVTMKAGVLKGPIIAKEPKLVWRNGGLEISEEIKLKVKRISPFDVYPGAYASDINDGPLMVRHRLPYSDLYAMIGLRGNKDDAIKRLLELYGSKGYSGWTDHIDSERDILEGRQQHSTESNLFEAIEYRGPASGKDLIAWGMPADKIDDELKSYEVEAWLIGHEVIRCVLNPDPLKRKPFYKASAVNQPGAWWGEGIPELMADIQELSNYVIRALAENVSVASGPQVALDPKAVPTGEDITSIHAWKIWQIRQGNTSTGVPIQFFQPQMHGQQLLGIYDSLSKYADDVTGIPAYSYGSNVSGGAASTASGLSMLMGSAAKGIKEIIKNIDYAIGPMVERYYIHNMLFDDDESIKGDAQVKARGATALIQKETQQLRNQEMLQATNNPVDLEILGLEGRAEMLRHAYKSMDYKRDIVPTDEQLREKLNQQRAQAEAQMQQQAQATLQNEAGEPNSGKLARTHG